MPQHLWVQSRDVTRQLILHLCNVDLVDASLDRCCGWKPPSRSIDWLTKCLVKLYLVHFVCTLLLTCLITFVLL